MKLQETRGCKCCVNQIKSISAEDQLIIMSVVIQILTSDTFYFSIL